MLQRRRTKTRISQGKPARIARATPNPENGPQPEEVLRKALAECLHENEIVGD